jgi:hypothetical protein
MRVLKLLKLLKLLPVGDGEPGLQVTGVECRQLLLESHHHQTPVGAHVSNLRIEFDVLDLKDILKMTVLI